MLENAGIEFEQKSCGFDEESIQAKSPREFVYAATMGKLEWAKKEYGLEIALLCADTVVTSKGLILRKPKDKNDAREILQNQSGESVGILTCTAYANEAITVIDLSVTEYLFEKFDPQELEAYLDSKEWSGKAGGCMVEGFCKRYIKSQKGFESSAMGLTIERFSPFIKRLDPLKSTPSS